MSKITYLPSRAVIAVSGADRVRFLQGLLSNDVAKAAPGQAIWAALLTPQGKYQADFFIFAAEAELLLDAEAALLPELLPKLRRYILRAEVTLKTSPLAVYAGWDGAPQMPGITAPDPRLPDAGWRMLAAPGAPVSAIPEEYDRHRLPLGLPDGTRDLVVGKSILLEAGFDELNGISWTKGCYMGQELTARTRYRGLIKKRLLPVSGKNLPPPGTVLHSAEGIECGEMRGSAGDAGLAMIRLDALAAPVLGEGEVFGVTIPAWMKLPE
jgi:folate-binding protein YgfZ